MVVGQMIRHLRRRTQLSQCELANRIGIKPGPMNNIEQGRNLPSTPVAYAIARELGISLDQLFAMQSSEPMMINEHLTDYVRSEDESIYWVPSLLFSHHHLSVSRPQELDQSSSESLGKIADAFLALEDLCGAFKRARIPLEIPVPCNEGGIEDLARRVRSLFDIGQSVVFDYLELFENAGLRIVFCTLPNNLHSVGTLDSTNQNVLFFIHPDLSPERQLFRLVYELGTIFLRNAETTAEFTLDRAARRFAAYFLMPASAIYQTVSQIGIRPDRWTYDLLLRIKHRYGVSAQSFTIRLEELGLLAPHLAADFKERIHTFYAENDHAEPDASRRILSPNGRLGDLLHCALQTDTTGEAQQIQHFLRHEAILV
jgi:Zn-dependent peptidase ImmA (M78 family)/DNA-binding XRE family transcriptional regulator